jgi:hypothetical protein
MKRVPYIGPSDVHAPRRHWSLIHVIFEGGPSESSLAIGRWDNKPVLAMRWNGAEGSPLGNPQSRGLPTWFIVPKQYWKQILESEPFKSAHEDVLELARKFLEHERVYFLTKCTNPECRNYRGLALQTFHTNELRSLIPELQRDELKFYHIICDHHWKPNPKEKAELMTVFQASWADFCLRSTSGKETSMFPNPNISECASER